MMQERRRRRRLMRMMRGMLNENTRLLDAERQVLSFWLRSLPVQDPVSSLNLV